MTDKPKARPADPAIAELLAELALTGEERQRLAAGKYGVEGRWIFDNVTVKAAGERNCNDE